jgi:hypothetical protein
MVLSVENEKYNNFNPDYDPFVLSSEDILKLYLVKGSIEKSTM